MKYILLTSLFLSLISCGKRIEDEPMGTKIYKVEVKYVLNNNVDTIICYSNNLSLLYTNESIGGALTQFTTSSQKTIAMSVRSFRILN